jgi:peptidoglycan/LPS O-acetylase OafA/YrhL
LPFIDTLRGIAILLVIWIHHGQGFRGLPAVQVVSGFGQMGVQLFFVASAYTLCLSTDGRRFESKPVRKFYIRRFFRIAPLYYLGIGLYAAVAYIQFRFGGIDRLANYSARNVLANVTFLHGFIPSANNSVVPGGWSIATEMTFYAIFPLLFAMFKRYAIASRWFMYVAVAAAAIANLVVQLAIVRVLGRSGIANDTPLYYSILNQLPVFVIGMLLYFSDARCKSSSRDGLLALLFCVACFVSLNWLGRVGVILAPTLAAIGFAFLFQIARGFVVRVGVVEKIGVVSYSMYIFHFVFAWWMTAFCIDAGARFGLPLTVIYMGTLVMVVTATYWLAKLSKWAIEDRFVNLGRKVIKVISGKKPTASVSACETDDGSEIPE